MSVVLLNPAPRRRGLAPLEMVLVLPILLLLMALIINAGTVASWKVRGLSATRHAVWSSRWPRDPGAFPHPDYWPAPPEAQMRAVGAGHVPEIDDLRVDLPVARGPLPNDYLVHEELLDPTRGLRRGEARLERDYPMLAKMGPYDFEAMNRLLDDKWQYQRSGWEEQGEMLPANAWRRIPVIYRLPRVSSSYVNAYVAAANAIAGAPFRDDLNPLETWKDDEFVGYALRFGWPVPRQDFHPQLRRFCTLDPATAADQVENLIDRIQGNDERDISSVAERLAQAFIALYQRVIRELEGQLNAIPPPPPAEAAAIRAEINELNGKIAVLQQFLATLRNDES